MYNKTLDDYNKLFEVVEKYRKQKSNKPKRNIWNDITLELNNYFKVNANKENWRRQYDRAKERLEQTGSPLTKLNTKNIFLRKEIKNISKDTEEQKLQLKKYIDKPKTIEEIMLFLDIDEIRVLGLIQSIKFDGFDITYTDIDKTYKLEKTPVMDSKEYKHHIGDIKEFEFLVVSDNHWGTKYQQQQFVEHIYKMANDRGIKTVYHVGDIVDGYYKNRPEQLFELFAFSADDQKDYVVNHWPKYEGITNYLIIGNHDETHIKNGGFNIGKAIAKERKDFVYLGVGHAKIWLTPKCRLDLLHPLDGSSYAVSYSGQKYLDSLSGGDKPNILFVGHHHKAMYFNYRNVHYFEVPSMTQQSSWMKRKRLANESGAWFVKIKVDEEGTIISLVSEYVKQYKYLENDYVKE